MWPRLPWKFCDTIFSSRPHMSRCSSRIKLPLSIGYRYWIVTRNGSFSCWVFRRLRLSLSFISLVVTCTNARRRPITMKYFLVVLHRVRCCKSNMTTQAYLRGNRQCNRRKSFPCCLIGFGGVGKLCQFYVMCFDPLGSTQNRSYRNRVVQILAYCFGERPLKTVRVILRAPKAPQNRKTPPLVKKKTNPKSYRGRRFIG